MHVIIALQRRVLWLSFHSASLNIGGKEPLEMASSSISKRRGAKDLRLVIYTLHASLLTIFSNKKSLTPDSGVNSVLIEVVSEALKLFMVDMSLGASDVR